MRGILLLASVPATPAGARNGSRSAMTPAANRAAIVLAEVTSARPARVGAGIATAGRPQHAAAVAASPASGPGPPNKAAALPRRVLRPGATHLAMAEECMAVVLLRTSTGT